MRLNGCGARVWLVVVLAGSGTLWGCSSGGDGGGRGTVREIHPGADIRAGSPRFSPDGSRLGYTRDSGDVTSVAVMSTTGADSRDLAADGSYLTAMTWNLDGDRIIYAGEDDIRGVAVDGSESSVRVVNAFAALGPDLSPDGQRLAYGINGGTLHLADLTQSPAVETDLEVGGASPRFSPDGRTIAYWQAETWPTYKIQLMDLASRATTDLVTGDMNNGFGGVDWFSDGSRLLAGTERGIEIITLGPPVTRAPISDQFAVLDIDLSPDENSVAYGVNGQASLFILSDF